MCKGYNIFRSIGNALVAKTTSGILTFVVFVRSSVVRTIGAKEDNDRLNPEAEEASLSENSFLDGLLF